MQMNTMACKTLRQCRTKKVFLAFAYILCVLLQSLTSAAREPNLCQEMFVPSNKNVDPRSATTFLSGTFLKPEKIRILFKDQKTFYVFYERKEIARVDVQFFKGGNAYISQFYIKREDKAGNMKAFIDVLLARYLFLEYNFVLTSESRIGPERMMTEVTWKPLLQFGYVHGDFSYYAFNRDALENPQGWREMDSIIERSLRPWWNPLWTYKPHKNSLRLEERPIVLPGI